MLACHACGETNPERARFCLGCGAALSTEPVRQTRRTVTVLFCDITGSTALGEQLDPESLRQVMSRYFSCMQAAVLRHGGTVEKFIGDAVMAVFGIPVIHEDDAARAVRAAVDMRAGLAQLNNELESRWGVTLQTRTGVNTGEVITGDPASRQTMVTGDTVNVAARLEQAAGPGEILMGPATYELVRDVVTAEPAGSFTLRGKQAPVFPLRLLGATSHSLPRVRRHDAPLVGRDSERALLRLAAERVARDKTCHLVTVLGAAGIGKTRLVTEVIGDLGENWTVLASRCLPYGEGASYRPIAHVLRQAAGIGDDDSLAVAFSKVGTLPPENHHAATMAARAAQLMGLDSTAGPAQEYVWAVRKLLEHLAVGRAVALVIDDVHWAEPSLLELLEHIIDWSRDAAILLVTVARTELLELRPHWGGGKINATSIMLSPLPREESDALVRALVGGALVGGGLIGDLPDAEIPGEVTQAISRTAGGNPLFTEELVRMLVDDGRLRQVDDGWSALALNDVAIPPTVQALLAARIDQLSPAEQNLLQAASVVGEEFTRTAVEALVTVDGPSGAAQTVEELVRKDVLRQASPYSGAEPAFNFRHLLFRDAVYDSMPKGVRAELHQRFADWLEHTEKTRPHETDQLVAWHLEQACKHRLALGLRDDTSLALQRRAGELLASGGRWALDHGDMGSAANLLSRSVDLWPAGQAARYEALVDLGSARREIGDFSAAQAALDEAVTWASSTGDDRLLARGRLAQVWLRAAVDLEGWPTYARSVVDDAIAKFDEAGDEEGLARAWALVAETHWVDCQVAASERAQLRAIEHARRAGDRRAESENVGVWVGSSVYGPTPVSEAIRRCEQALADFRGQPALEGRVARTLACQLAMRGDFLEAREQADRCTQIFTDLGQEYWLASAGELDGFVERLAGRPADAERSLASSYTRLEAMGDTAYRSTVAAALADAVLAQGRDDDAEDYLKIGEATVAGEDRYTHILLRSARARLLERRGQSQRALALAREARELVSPTDLLNLHGDVLMLTAQLEQACGEPDTAAAMATEALDHYTRKENAVSAAAARSTLARLNP